MALSVKVALMTCLGFVFGMSWLVSLVARPMVELPTPLVLRGSGVASGTALAEDVAARSAPVAVAGRFERASPVEGAAKTDQREGDTFVVAEALPRDAGLEELSLPPLYVPEAPVIARADQPSEEPTPLPAAGNAVMTITSIPEAIIADSPARGARVLAALVGRSAPAEEAAAEPAARASADRATRGVREYRVKRGDTLVKIMRREWNSDDTELLDALLAANPQIAKRRDRIFPGEVLYVPDVESSPGQVAARLTAARAAPGGGDDWGGAAAGRDIRWYTVRKRDSLASIARRQLNDEARWRDIARLNELRNADRILPGTRIKLPPAETDT